MLKERDHSCSHRHQLLGRNIHIVNLIRFHFKEFTPFPRSDTFVCEGPVLVDRVVGLRDDERLLLISCDVFNLIADLPFFHLSVWCFNKTEFIDPRVSAHRVDQSDVWSLRSLDWTDSSVV